MLYCLGLYIRIVKIISPVTGVETNPAWQNTCSAVGTERQARLLDDLFPHMLHSLSILACHTCVNTPLFGNTVCSTTMPLNMHPNAYIASHPCFYLSSTPPCIPSHIPLWCGSQLQPCIPPPRFPPINTITTRIPLHIPSKHVFTQSTIKHFPLWNHKNEKHILNNFKNPNSLE